MTDAERIEAAFEADIEDYRRRFPGEVPRYIEELRRKWRENPVVPAPVESDQPAPWRIGDYIEGQCQVVDAGGDSVVMAQGDAWFDYRIAVRIVDAVNAREARP